MSESLKIKLSRGQGEIKIPSKIPTRIPEALNTNIKKITVKELKRICDEWGISRRCMSKSIDLQNAIIRRFNNTSPTESDPKRDDEKVSTETNDDTLHTFTYGTKKSNLVDEILGVKVFKTQNGKTQQNSSSQQGCFEKIIKRHGFNELKKCDELTSIKSGVYCHLNPGKYYIDQPRGSQRSPDYLLIHVSDKGYSKIIEFECKIGCDGIMWNDGFPEKTRIYMFSCTKFNKTSLYDGADLINKDALEVYQKFIKMRNEMNLLLRTKLATNDFNPTIRGAWGQKHISEKKSRIEQIKSRFTQFLSTRADTFSSHLKGISLFAGAGGDTHGMEMSGIKVIGFVEKNRQASATHLKNFPHSKHIGSDITKIPDSTFSKYKNKIDYLFGGFPCQSFSHGGKKDPRDPRGQLYVDFVRATKCIQPTWVIGENVKGILSRVNDKGECMADVVVEAFEKIGYNMKYKLVNASNFGVPQSRERVIFVGHKTSHDLKLGEDGLQIPTGNGLLKTLRDTLEFSLEDAMEMSEDLIRKIPENKFVEGECDIKVFGSPPANLIKCAAKKTSKDDITYKTRGKSTFSCIVDIDDVSRTLICTYAHMPRLFVPVSTGDKKYMRPYTVLECQRIQGFPDAFKVTGKKGDQIKQIGNAVPPIIISCVIDYLNKL